MAPRPRLAGSVLLLYLNEDTFSEEEDESSPLTSVICRALDARPAGHRRRLEFQLFTHDGMYRQTSSL